jgi:hypothetical protein
VKDLVIRKKWGTEGEYIITQDILDVDEFALQYYDKWLDVTLSILRGGDTDGGSIPNIAKGVFDPLLDKTAHGFIFHDELWRHRVYYKELYKSIGMTFTETNRIMKDIHTAAGCSWAERNLTRLGVRYGGWYKWNNPSERVKSVKTPTLVIRGGKHVED